MLPGRLAGAEVSAGFCTKLAGRAKHGTLMGQTSVGRAQLLLKRQPNEVAAEFAASAQRALSVYAPEAVEGGNFG